MNKYLVLKGCAGLGNRFITLMKAIQYATISHRILYIDWGDGMFAKRGNNIFYQYFELLNINTLNNPQRLIELLHQNASTYPRNMKVEDLMNPIYSEREAKGGFFIYTPTIAKNTMYKIGLSIFPLHKLVYGFGLQSFQRIEKRNGLNWWKVVVTANDQKNFPLGSNLWPWLREDIVFFADFRPLVNMNNLFHYLKLKNEFKEKIDQIAIELDLINAVGIHVRYTDKKPTKKLGKLYDHCKEKLREDSSLKIFLCTDNIDIVKEFKYVFCDKLILLDKFIPKVEGDGIHIWAAQNNNSILKQRMFEDSLIEMWLLSKTRELYWQGNSSFSYISKLLINNSKPCKDWMKL